MNQKNNNNSILIAAALVAAWYFTQGPGSKPSPPGPAPGPNVVTPDVAAPTAAMQQQVAGLKPIAAQDGPAAKFIAAAHRDLAEVIGRSDGESCKTLGAFKDLLTRYHVLLFQRSEFVGKLPGFGAAVEAIFDGISVKDSPYDKERATELLNAIAWAMDN